MFLKKLKDIFWRFKKLRFEKNEKNVLSFGNRLASSSRVLSDLLLQISLLPELVSGSFK
jgi:hypothetical protein